MTRSSEKLWRQLADSGILTLVEAERLASFSSQDATRLSEAVEELVERGQLTSYQSRCLSEGRGAEILLGNYIILDELGEGGMGRIYKARHRRMKRVVALKVLAERIANRSHYRERFRREAEVAARLSHPNIVTAYDADEVDGLLFLVMEFVDGRDLANLVEEEGPLPWRRAVDYVIQAAEGLAFAHRQGVIHRDMKPNNLLLDRQGTVKILDLGLARIVASIDQPGETSLTQEGNMLGTVDYMSPEQSNNAKSADGRSDQYSLGCTLHFLLTGRPVYGGTTFGERLAAHQSTPIPELELTDDTVPEELGHVFRRMVQKDPRDRYPTIDEAGKCLRRLLSASPGESRLGATSKDTSSFENADTQDAPFPGSTSGSLVGVPGRWGRRSLLIGLALLPLVGTAIYFRRPGERPSLPASQPPDQPAALLAPAPKNTPSQPRGPKLAPVAVGFPEVEERDDPALVTLTLDDAFQVLADDTARFLHAEGEGAIAIGPFLLPPRAPQHTAAEIVSEIKRRLPEELRGGSFRPRMALRGQVKIEIRADGSQRAIITALLIDELGETVRTFPPLAIVDRPSLERLLSGSFFRKEMDAAPCRDFDDCAQRIAASVSAYLADENEKAIQIGPFRAPQGTNAAAVVGAGIKRSLPPEIKADLPEAIYRLQGEIVLVKDPQTGASLVTIQILIADELGERRRQFLKYVLDDEESVILLLGGAPRDIGAPR